MSKSFAFGGRWPVSPMATLEAEADYTTYDKTNDIVVRRDYIGQLVTTNDNHSRDKWSPRAGVVFRPSECFAIRAAWQEWLRPASLSSLKPTSTAGIVLDDRYVLPGGKLERARVQPARPGFGEPELARGLFERDVVEVVSLEETALLLRPLLD